MLKCQIHTIRSLHPWMDIDYDAKLLVWGNIFLRNASWLLGWDFLKIHEHWGEACAINEFIERISWLKRLWKNKVLRHEKHMDLRGEHKCDLFRKTGAKAQYLLTVTFDREYVYLRYLLYLLFNICSCSKLA